MKCPHRIRVSSAGFELDRGSTGPATCDHQTQKAADWSGKFFWRNIRALFDNLHRIKVSLRFRTIRVPSQIATDLAVRELVVVIFNTVIHFSVAIFVYTRVRPEKFRSGYEGRTSMLPGMSTDSVLKSSALPVTRIRTDVHIAKSKADAIGRRISVGCAAFLTVGIRTYIGFRKRGVVDF